MTAYSRDDTHILHVHIPKTGGLSITKLFEQNGFKVALIEYGEERAHEISLKRCAYQHMHADMLQAILRLTKFRLIFSVIRHPIERFKSAHQWNTFHNPMDIEEWGPMVFDQYQEDPFLLDNHIRPQSEFILPQTKIFKYEDGLGDRLIDQIESLAEISITHRTFERRNDISTNAGRRSGETDISPSLRRRVEDFYARDFEMFGYE
jgi:hypothetical protein